MVVRHRRIIFAVLTGFVVLFLILVLATPISFPYAASKSGPSPQRVQIMARKILINTIKNLFKQIILILEFIFFIK